MSKPISQLFSLPRLRANWAPKVTTAPADIAVAQVSDTPPKETFETPLAWLNHWLATEAPRDRHAIFSTLLADLERLFQAHRTAATAEKIALARKIEENLTAIEDLMEALNVSR